MVSQVQTAYHRELSALVPVTHARAVVLPSLYRERGRAEVQLLGGGQDRAPLYERRGEGD
jgi:hypothetical protein